MKNIYIWNPKEPLYLNQTIDKKSKKKAKSVISSTQMVKR